MPRTFFFIGNCLALPSVLMKTEVMFEVGGFNLGHMPVERSQTSLGFVQAVVSVMAYQYIKSQKFKLYKKECQ